MKECMPQHFARLGKSIHVLKYAIHMLLWQSCDIIDHKKIREIYGTSCEQQRSVSGAPHFHIESC